jgi:hypothetical protein
MTQAAAKRSLSIQIITWGVVLAAAGFLVASVFDPSLLFAGALFGFICISCYLLAPASYELSDGRLTVFRHLGTKQFGPVVRCSQIAERIPFTLRLFGNGGLFAGTGIFWNKRYGVFRAYVTSARHSDLVLVETPTGKIIISPENPQAFVEAMPGSCPGPHAD